MQSILEQITDWLKSMIISGIMGNLSGMFDSVNQQVGQIAGDVGTTPANFSPAVFSMIRNISESVILPIAGMVLTFIACYELIQMLIEHNNLANFETWTFFKWVFKTFLAVTLISNTFNITMAVFDVAQQVISRSGGLISGSTSVSDATLTAMQATLEGMDLGPLLGLYLQTFVVQVTMLALSAIIFVIVYGRMVEIYLMVSLAPIPFATFGNHEQSHTGQNYLRSLFALGFQGFLIMICVGIYAVLIQNLSFTDNIISSIWGVMGYTVLLAFTLFKTGSLAKSFDQNWCQGYEADAVTLTPLGESCAPGTQEKVDETIAAIKDGSLHVFDTSKFTVGGKTVTTAFATDTDGDFVPDADEAVFDGYYHESYFQSAPSFQLRIDGITELN